MTHDKDNTLKNSNKLLSYTPPNRLSYKEWVEFIGVKEMVWLYDPDGKEKAEKIMENVGLLPEKTLLDLILNG